MVGKALELLIPYAWRSVDDGGLGLYQLTAGCAAGNRASARALRRAGFSLVGTERQAIRVDEAAQDALVFDLLATDDREARRVQPGRIPVIETERFRLRPWTSRDVPGPDEGPDPASLRYMPPGAHPDASTFPAWLRRRQLGQDADEHLNWAIADRETNHALGNMTVFRLDPVANRFQAEIGYWLHPTARGQGVLGEVMPAIVDHAFVPVADGGMGLSRLYAETDLDNGASQAVLLRAGFRRWGQDRYAFRNGAGDVTDGAYFELLGTDERLDRRPQRVDEVTLEGDRVRLRPWRDDDAERVVEACTDPRSMHWLSGLPNPYTLEHAGEYIRRLLRPGGPSGPVVPRHGRPGERRVRRVDRPDGSWRHGSDQRRGRLLGSPGRTRARDDRRSRGVAGGPCLPADDEGRARPASPRPQGGRRERRLAATSRSPTAFTGTGMQRQAERLGDGSSTTSSTSTCSPRPRRGWRYSRDSRALGRTSTQECRRRAGRRSCTATRSRRSCAYDIRSRVTRPVRVTGLGRQPARRADRDRGADRPPRPRRARGALDVARERGRRRGTSLR